MTIRNPAPYLHTIDVVVMRYVADTKPGRIEVLLHQRPHDPYQGAWALPGLVVNGDTPDPSLGDALKRLIGSDKVGMEPIYTEQVGTEGNAYRDPRCWSSTTYYLVIVDRETQAGAGQLFVPLDDLEHNRTALPFDHNLICARVAERLRSKSLYSSLPLLFLGDMLTLTESVEVVSCVLKRDVQKSSIRVRLGTLSEAGYLAETDQKKGQAAGRKQVLIRNRRPGQVFFFDRCFER